ncbi:MAG: heme-binding domain-containing protein [Mariniphaga sp.]|nr:heme-binding domain-containing protein [Mariniphaga sp.]
MFIVVIIVAFIALQFFQPEKNNQAIDNNHIFSSTDIPAPIQEILKSACLDCHSNQTRYPWYDRISPVSWYVTNHIEEGKEELNFSEWKRLSAIDKISLLNKICEETEEKKMPLKNYTAMHKSAKLTDKQIAELCNWAESYGMKIFKANL